MKNYIVYFQIFGKKMRTSVNARSKAEAKQKIQAKIIFDKVVERNDESDFDFAKRIFDFLK